MPRSKGSKFPGIWKDYSTAVRMYESGLSVADVAEFFGVTRQSMHKSLGRRGVKFRSNLRFGTANHFHRGTRADDRAQGTLEKAVAKGVVLRKTHCEECGASTEFADGRSGIQAHHPDYNKPLDVIWLCQHCHHEWHKCHRAIPRERR